MYQIWIYTLGSVIAISIISLIGILTISIKKSLLEKLILYMVSFAVGALLGGAFLHLMPEIANETGFRHEQGALILGGIIIFFVLEKFIHWRHCHVPTSDKHPHPFAIINLIGDMFHNFMDGLIIAGSYLVSIPLGISTTLAVILHEIPQEIGDFGVLIHGGYSKKKALLLNFITALTAVIGAILVLTMGSQINHIEHYIAPITAGGFIYIAGSDLIPELHKQTCYKKYFGQFFSIILGITIMASLLLLEHGH